MEHFYFQDYLSSNIDVDREWLTSLLSTCKILHFKKGDYALKRGTVNTQSYFVQKGLLRYYSIDQKGKEHILQFAPEGWFISDRQSACLETPSDFFIDALENSEVMVIDEGFVNELASQNNDFLLLNNKLLNNHIRSLQSRINQLLSFSAEERYLNFIKIYPDILLRVPQTMVASYLGITPESLSRVRKALGSKHKSNNHSS